MTPITTRPLLRPSKETDLGAVFELHSGPRTKLHNPAGLLKTYRKAATLLEGWQRHGLERGQFTERRAA